MGELTLWMATAGLVLGIFWLGTDPEDPLVRVLLRPAVLALMALLVVVLTLGEPVRWPYGLVAVASFLGVWESYIGAYQVLSVTVPKRKLTQQVQVCTLWLINAMVNLILLNMAAYLAFPSTFQWRGETASLLDVAYLTMLTFASAGYGDVLPATSLGKLLVMMTSLAGLVYATILFGAVFQSLRQD